MKKEILGVKIDDVSLDEAVKIVGDWLLNSDPASPAKRGEKHYITTPNPEILMMAHQDQQLKNILNNADLSVPDGAGLKLAGNIVCLTPGIDLMEQLVKVAEDQGFTVGFLGGRDEVAKKTAECLLKKYPKLKVSFAESGGEVDNQGKSLKYPKLLRSLNCDILFVAFGPPKQEKWIADNLDKIPVKVAMGVGGAFDYLSGQIPRAPKWLRSLGFEWLFRLLIQPWRIKRQIALIKYLLMIV